MAVAEIGGRTPHQGRTGPSTNYKSRASHPDEACPLEPNPSSKDSSYNNGRSSFSSIREDDTDLAQAFTASKVSSYSHQQQHEISSALDDHPSPAMGTMVQHAEFFPPITRPDSRLHGNWYPADNFRGWKQINVKGRLASRSFGDLHLMNLAWTTHPDTTVLQKQRRPSGHAPGDAPMERLPLELLSNIIGLLVIDVPPNSLTKRNIDLMSLLLTSKKVHGATLVTLYRQITIPHSTIFKKFLGHVASHAALGTLVRRFDFSHFNPNMMFTTASERSLAQNLTATTLLQALELTPHLQEFLSQEHIDGDIDAHVLQKLFFGLDRIAALDFCGCTSSAFRAAFVDAFPATAEEWAADLALKRLSLHKCTTLPSTVFESLLPHLPHLTHLDVAGTRITDAALASIPKTARLTHLNLAKCSNLSADAIIQFLAEHPAAAAGPGSSTLAWLSLATDASTHETFDESAISRLLPVLPSSLKSLSLKGSRMNTSHIPLLLPLTKHLEELALGRGLKITDTNTLFGPTSSSADSGAMDVDSPSSPVVAEAAWCPHTLHYLDLSDLWSTELDLPTLYDTAQCALLARVTEPLEVLEVSADAGRRLRDAPLRRLGWHRSEAGARTWVVRDSASGGEVRSWKMGAESWGMRKVPVARADVGGMYGSYMFARRL
ncbi:hypothetical protein M406DRAFT_37475 [Cryphonectria parasitica EP155]|uniref:F-box domain-containing protein n=1 Tax=Cryphonectria parasitica (strain ATCC 38755 / EP155) TaxID=660469 RepID=A0A9P4Y3P1_CRYP1|nr:uncharacterized protein M406DRAFT_37475 [Cryphonectria parasitica EP155]KAF3766359.1 hypothetical protein M406DRAFT_37475 [Cryphonectria parasitica EP155]